MDLSFADITPPWDLSQATTFSQLADEEFLALLQKQFPTSTSPTLTLSSDFATSVDPNDVSRYSMPSYNPPSEDSSPSPPRDSQQRDDDMSAERDLKRKASIDDDLDEGPSSKAQHTCKPHGAKPPFRTSQRRAAASNKKGGASRRKSGGGPVSTLVGTYPVVCHSYNCRTTPVC